MILKYSILSNILEDLLIINLFTVILLSVSILLKEKVNSLKNWSILDIYLYQILYLIIIILIFAYIDKLHTFHSIFFLISGIFILFSIKSISKIKFNTFIKPLIFLNLILLLCVNLEFIWWDEISSWGLRTKEILLNDSVYYENVKTNLSKPSGSSFLHYFFIKYVGNNESLIIFAQSSTTILILISIFKDFNPKYKNKDLIYFLIIVYFISFIFNYGLFSIYTGLITSLFFLKIISIFCIKNDNNFIKNFFLAFPFCFLFIFFKDFSLFYIVYLISFFLLFIFIKKNKKSLTNLLAIIIPITLSILILHLFNRKLGITGPAQNTTISDLIDIIFLLDINLNKLISINVFQSSIFRIPNQLIEIIFSSPSFFYEIKTNILFWLIVISIINLILFLSNKVKFKKNLILLSLMYSFFFIHTFLILISYQIFFGANEASALASFGRYAGLYLMPYLIFLTLTLNNFLDKDYIKLIFITLLIIIAPAKSIEILIPENLNTLNSHLNEIRNNKKDISTISKYIKKEFDNKKVYLLINNDDGFYHNVFKFYLYPTNTNLECWSFKKNKKKTTYMFNCNYSNKTDIYNKISKYDLIINYKNNLIYNNILEKSNFVKIHSIGNSSIFVKN